MIGICRGLTLDAAVTIDMASTAALGRDANLIGTGGVRARLGRPAAARALESVVTATFSNVNNPSCAQKYECYNAFDFDQVETLIASLLFTFVAMCHRVRSRRRYSISKLIEYDTWRTLACIAK